MRSSHGKLTDKGKRKKQGKSRSEKEQNGNYREKILKNNFRVLRLKALLILARIKAHAIFGNSCKITRITFSNSKKACWASEQPQPKSAGEVNILRGNLQPTRDSSHCSQMLLLSRVFKQTSLRNLMFASQEVLIKRAPAAVAETLFPIFFSLSFIPVLWNDLQNILPIPKPFLVSTADSDFLKICLFRGDF